MRARKLKNRNAVLTSLDVSSSPQFNANDELASSSLAQCIALGLHWAITTSRGRAGPGQRIVDCRCGGNHAPQSDPCRRLGCSLPERQNGACVRQSPGFAVAAGRLFDPARDGPRLTEGRPQAPSSSGPESADSTLSCLIIKRSSTAWVWDDQGSPGPAWTPPPQMLSSVLRVLQNR